MEKRFYLELFHHEIALKLFRKKIPEKYEMAVNTAGFVALMGFMLLVTFHDVFKLFG